MRALTCSRRRLIAALLLFFVLGMQLTSARSTSHEQVRHSHRADSATHAADHHDGHADGDAGMAHAGANDHDEHAHAGHHVHDDDDGAGTHDDQHRHDGHDGDDGHGNHDGHGGHGGHGKHGGRFSHVHDHNPGDHTHDLALRPTVKPLAAPPPCGWQPALLAMPAARHPLPLERPPRRSPA